MADCKQHPGALPSTAPTSHSSCLLCVKWSKQTVDIQFPGLISCDSVPRAYMWLRAAILVGRGQDALALSTLSDSALWGPRTLRRTHSVHVLFAWQLVKHTQNLHPTQASLLKRMVPPGRTSKTNELLCRRGIWSLPRRRGDPGYEAMSFPSLPKDSVIIQR